MKFFALIFLVVGNLIVGQALAGDISGQPLTRADCDRAAMTWDETANVCTEKDALFPAALQAAAENDASSQPLRRPECDRAGRAWDDDANVCGSGSEVAVTSSQPLTRNECDKASMRWNDDANVCGENVSSAPTKSNPATKKPGLAIVINIDKTKQRMRVFVDGVEKYKWPVSTGRPSYFTPSGTYAATSMNEVWYSKEWDNAPMPYAIFFMTDGHAIHGSYEVNTFGKPVSHGCVRISPQNAATLYALVGKNGLEKTQVVLTGLTPGGEGKVASSARPRSRKVASSARPGSRYVQVAPRSFKPGDNSYAEPQRRRRLFGRWFSGSYYNGPQGYYRPPPAY